MKDKLTNLGFIYDVCAGFQLDLNSVLIKTFKGISEGHLCDHNCTTENGNYDCPAAFSRNRDVVAQSSMTLEDITKTLQIAKEGLLMTNVNFLDRIFPLYVSKFLIPREIEYEIRKLLCANKVELNLFGGNPELHPDFLQIIKIAKETQWKVTTTTTGKKFMYDNNFVEGFLNCMPDLLAISADDYENIDELKRLIEMPLENLKTYWLKANPLYGQRKKAYESIYVAKFSQVQNNFCPILFNIVVHPGNISCIESLLETLHAAFPNALLNPYPAQSSFSFSLVDWKEENIPLIEKFIDRMIDKQIKQADKNKKIYVPRLSYWLALKSIFMSKLNPQDSISHISGYDTWRCYASSGAGRYLQAASAQKTSTQIFKSGGHPGCFWNNNTITDATKHIWELKPQDIQTHILQGKTKLAQAAKKPCPGCLMPRLMFDAISTELGLNQKLVPAYLKLRQKYFGF